MPKRGPRSAAATVERSAKRARLALEAELRLTSAAAEAKESATDSERPKDAEVPGGVKVGTTAGSGNAPPVVSP